MQRKVFRLGLWVLAVGVLSSCNIYSVFRKNGDDNAYLEAARDCIHDGDYTCAIDHYNQLSNTTLKNKKLCQAYISKAGLTLDGFIDVVSTNSDNILGQLANALICPGDATGTGTCASTTPWTETREADAAAAKTACEAYDGTDATAQLLKTIGAFVDCAMRMVKTDIMVSGTNQTTACDSTTAAKSASGHTGENDGRVTATDVGPTDGDVDSNNTGMCAFDVNACVSAIGSLSSNALSGAGLNDLESAFEQLPANLKDTTQTEDIKRKAVRDAI